MQTMYAKRMEWRADHVSPFILSGHLILLLTPLVFCESTLAPASGSMLTMLLAPSRCHSPSYEGLLLAFAEEFRVVQKGWNDHIIFFFSFFSFPSLFTIYLIRSSYPPLHIARPLQFCPCPSPGNVQTMLLSAIIVSRSYEGPLLASEELRIAQKGSNDHIVSLFCFFISFSSLFHPLSYPVILSSSSLSSSPVTLCLCPCSCWHADHIARCHHHVVILWGTATHIRQGA
jgi:hypothetical protein